MDIARLIQSPATHIAAFAEKQVLLYREDIRLQDYFEILQLDQPAASRANIHDQLASNRFFATALKAAGKATRARQRGKIKVDVLIVPSPYFSRKTETRFFVRTVLGVAQTGAKILCLIPDDAPCRGELDTRLAAMGRTGQVEFIDPMTPSNRVEVSVGPRLARIRGRSAFAQTVEILGPHGLSPSRQLKVDFERIAYFVEAWERLAPWIEFDSAIVRCHWYPLCSSVCRTAQQRGKPVITFQQGVIGHTLDVPVTASKYVAFGPTSSSFLARVNSDFFQAVGVSAPQVEYVNGGCLYDTITVLPDQFDRKTLLMVDVPTAQGDFYGAESQGRALLELARRILTSNLPSCRIIIRPHPYWNNLDFDACQQLVREYSTRCELSHPVWSLEDDLRRSSCTIGIFSGVLTVASACGLPTIFLETEKGFKTGDLACFSPHQTLMPEAAFCEIERIMTDRGAYAEARGHSMRNASAYYAGGSNADLGGDFFGRLLQAEPMTKRVRDQVE